MIYELSPSIGGRRTTFGSQTITVDLELLKGLIIMNRRAFLGASTATPFSLARNISTPTPPQESTSVSDPWEFDVSNFDFKMLDVDSLIFNRDILIPIRSGDVVDDDGIPVLKNEDGTVSNNPVTQAQYLLGLLSNFRQNSDPQYLELAEAIGTRFIEYSTMIDGARFYPYNWDHTLLGDPLDQLRGPWFSGMAQGHVLQCFTRLWQATGDDSWMTYADETAESFKKIGDSSRPGTMRTNERAELWIEEYPDSTYKETLNGHIFGYFGLYEYWMITQDDIIKQIMDGAMTTVLNVVDTHLRVPGQPSHYAILQPSQPDGYHVIHTAQILETYRITGDQRFAELAIRLHRDYPPFQIRGKLELQPGTYEMFSEESVKPHLIRGDGESLEIESPTTIIALQRRRVWDQDIFYYRFYDKNEDIKWIQETDTIRVLGELTGAQSPFGPLFGTRMNFEPPTQMHVSESLGTAPVSAIAIVDLEYQCQIEGDSGWTPL